jgi:tRNA(Ile)-lysidine synthase
MVLAHLLLGQGVSFGVAHINFMLRGEDSTGDEAFVAAFADRHQLPFYVTRFDTLAEAERRKTGIQETARDLRYAWLESIRSQQGFGAILTAHHATDNVETLIANLLRGTGITGLHGILPQQGYIMRPLLIAQRTEIEAYAQTHELEWREDASNASDKYLRNAIRHHVLPALQQVSPDALDRIAANIPRLAEGGMLYRRAVDRELASLQDVRGHDIYIPVRKLRLRTPLQTLVFELSARFGFTTGQVPRIINLLDAESGRFIASPTHRIIRNREFLIITSLAPSEAGLLLVPPFPASVTAGNDHFSFELIPVSADIPTGPDEVWLDADVLVPPLYLRQRKTGDYLYPLGMGMKKKKLSRLLIDLKVPLHLKDQLWILESDGRIAWVAGLRPDERFKITPRTKSIVRIVRTSAT